MISKLGGSAMDTQIFRKFCPVCKLSNLADAVVCRHCGAKLGKAVSGPPTTERVDDSFELTDELKERVTRERTPPSRGMAIFLLNNSQPIALNVQQEFILGRAGDATSEPVVDLTDYEAFALGVSRRHAMIQAAGDKYV